MKKNCIITSLNLYEFSQVNNNEMGVFISRDEDIDVYKDAYDEAKRIIRISDEVRISMETVKPSEAGDTVKYKKLTTSKIAKQLDMTTQDFLSECREKGYIIEVEGRDKLTNQGLKIGAEFKYSKKYGVYFLWPIGMVF